MNNPSFNIAAVERDTGLSKDGASARISRKEAGIR